MVPGRPPLHTVSLDILKKRKLILINAILLPAGHVSSNH